jgi:hypothetical protein
VTGSEQRICPKGNKLRLHDVDRPLLEVGHFTCTEKRLACWPYSIVSFPVRNYHQGKYSSCPFLVMIMSQFYGIQDAKLTSIMKVSMASQLISS